MARGSRQVLSRHWLHAAGSAGRWGSSKQPTLSCQQRRRSPSGSGNCPSNCPVAAQRTCAAVVDSLGGLQAFIDHSHHINLQGRGASVRVTAPCYPSSQHQAHRRCLRCGSPPQLPTRQPHHSPLQRPASRSRTWGRAAASTAATARPGWALPPGCALRCSLSLPQCRPAAAWRGGRQRGRSWLQSVKACKMLRVGARCCPAHLQHCSTTAVPHTLNQAKQCMCTLPPHLHAGVPAVPSLDAAAGERVAALRLQRRDVQLPSLHPNIVGRVGVSLQGGSRAGEGRPGAGA